MPIARYWRFNVTAVDGGSYASAAEFQLYSSTDGTGTNLCLGKTATQTGDSSVGSASGANDDNTNSEAGSTFTGSYIWSVDLGSPGFVGSAGIVAQQVVPNRTAKDFTVQYSTDNSNWQTASTHTNQTGWVQFERRTFVVDSSSVSLIYEGSIKQITVPANATSAVVRMWGGGGGSGGDGSSSGSKGGAGGFLKFTIPSVTPGETFAAQVGSGGLKGPSGGQNRRPGTGGGSTSLYRGDPFYKDVSLLLHMDGSTGSATFTDTSANAMSVTPFNGAQISGTPSKFGNGSLSLSGSQWLEVPDSQAFDLSGDFTVEAWVYFNATTDAALLGGDNTGNFDFAFVGNEIRLGRINTNWDSSAPFIRNTGIWYHVAWCRQYSTLRFFVDGQLKNSVPNTIAYSVTAANMVIGGSTNSERRLNGYINDLRITKGTARYIAAFTPPTAAFPDPLDRYYQNNSLLLHMNGTNGSTTFTDNSSVPKTITANGGAQISTTQSKFGGSSLFTGTSGNNFLQIPASNDFIFGTGNFTVEGWFLPSGAGDERTFYIHGINTIGGLTLFVGTGGARFRANGTTDLVAGSSITTWTHIAFVRSGNTRYIFINGALSNSDSLSFNVSDDVVTDIGASSQNASDSFKYYGYIDDLRITKGVARYTAAFNPPNREFANDNGIIAIVGAGGGGGGYGTSFQYSWGGSGGDTTANPGGDALSPSFATGGGGGTQIAGGIVGTPGTGLNGSYLQGGAGAGYDLGTQSAGGWPNGGVAVQIDERGGGGGGGYYGGGGGGGQGTHGAGGGGGSSYIYSGATQITHTKSTPNVSTAPGNSEQGYIAGAAVGGYPNDNGGNGLIFIEYVFASFSVNGTVYDSNNNPASRIVRLYSRSTGNLMAETTSNGTTGAYNFPALSSTDEVQVICLDDSGGSLENDLVHRTFPV